MTQSATDIRPEGAMAPTSKKRKCLFGEVSDQDADRGMIGFKILSVQYANTF